MAAESAADDGRSVSLPNLLSLARLLSVPLIVLLILEQRWISAFVVFVLAGLSDALDGFVARHWDLRTRLGVYLDPLADKTLLVAIYISLAAQAMLPLWLVVLVVSRDLLIVGGALLLYMLGFRAELAPSRVSKLNTVMQIVFAGVVLGGLALGLNLPTIGLQLLNAAVAATTIASGAGYLLAWGRQSSTVEGR